MRELSFYGFIFSSQGLSPDPKTVQTLKSVQRPENAKALKSFIGMAAYSSRFIKNYSIITAPMRELLKKMLFGIGAQSVRNRLTL